MSALLAFTTLPSATVALAESLQSSGEESTESFTDERDDEGLDDDPIAEEAEEEESEGNDGEDELFPDTDPKEKVYVPEEKAGESESLIDKTEETESETESDQEVTESESEEAEGGTEGTAGAEETVNEPDAEEDADAEDGIAVIAENEPTDNNEAREAVRTIAGIRIEDDIFENGDLIARIYDENKQEITDHSGLKFVWYRSVERGLGTNADPEKIQWEKVVDDEALDKDDNYGDSQADINVARDQGGLHWYYAEVFDENGKLLISGKSEAQYVDYAMELLNGSFEEPLVSSGGHKGNHQFLQDEVPHWSSTSLDKEHNEPAIEIAEYSAKSTIYGTNKNHNGGADTGIYATGSQDTSGNQFAEINANTEGSLYQDVLTAPGASLNWSLYHRARTGDGSDTIIQTAQTNTMYVVIMSGVDARKVLAGVSSGSQQKVLTDMLDTVVAGGTYAENVKYKLVAGNEKGQTVTVTAWLVSTTNLRAQGDWTHYTGSYNVPEGQYVTRFFFVAKKGTGSRSMGNLIDKVEFSEKMSYHIDYYIKDKDTDANYVLQSKLSEGGIGVEPYTHITPASLESLKQQGYSLVGSVTGTATGGTEDIKFQEVTQDHLTVAPRATYLSLYLVKAVDWTELVPATTDWAELEESHPSQERDWAELEESHPSQERDWAEIGPGYRDWAEIGPGYRDWAEIGPGYRDWAEIGPGYIDWTDIEPDDPVYDLTDIGPAAPIYDWTDIEPDDPIYDWTDIGPALTVDKPEGKITSTDIIKTGDENRPLPWILVIAAIAVIEIYAEIYYRKEFKGGRDERSKDDE